MTPDTLELRLPLKALFATRVGDLEYLDADLAFKVVRIDYARRTVRYERSAGGQTYVEHMQALEASGERWYARAVVDEWQMTREHRLTPDVACQEMLRQVKDLCRNGVDVATVEIQDQDGVGWTKGQHPHGEFFYHLTLTGRAKERPPSCLSPQAAEVLQEEIDRRMAELKRRGTGR